MAHLAWYQNETKLVTIWKTLVSKRQRMAELLLRAPALVGWRLKESSRISVFGFHRIGHSPYGDPALFDCSVEQFEIFVDWLASNAPTMSLKELQEIHCGQAPLVGPRSIVTFDDGYVDNLEAARVLADRDQTGVFFICPEALQKRRVGWWERLFYACSQTPLASFTFNSHRYELPIDQSELYRDLVSFVKVHPLDSALSFVMEIESTLQAPMPGAVADDMLLSEENLLELQNLSMDIGSHTQSHRVLSTLSDDEQRRELLESKHQLEIMTGCFVDSIAYPVGHHDAINRKTLSIAQSLGYQLGFTLSAGQISHGFDQWLQVPRYEAQSSWQLNAATMVVPRLFRKRGQGVWRAH